MENESYRERQRHERRCSILRKNELESSFENMFRNSERRIKMEQGKRMEEKHNNAQVTTKSMKNKAVAD